MLFESIFSLSVLYLFLWSPLLFMSIIMFCRFCVPSSKKERSRTQVHRNGTLCHRKTFVTRLVATALSVNSTYSCTDESSAVNCKAFLDKLFFYFTPLPIILISGNSVIFMLFVFLNADRCNARASSSSRHSRNDYYDDDDI